MIALSILVGVEALSTSAVRSIRHKAFRPARPCATCPRVAVYPQMSSPLRLAPLRLAIVTTVALPSLPLARALLAAWRLGRP